MLLVTVNGATHTWSDTQNAHQTELRTRKKKNNENKQKIAVKNQNNSNGNDRKQKHIPQAQWSELSCYCFSSPFHVFQVFHRFVCAYSASVCEFGVYIALRQVSVSHTHSHRPSRPCTIFDNFLFFIFASSHCESSSAYAQ